MYIQKQVSIQVRKDQAEILDLNVNSAEVRRMEILATKSKRALKAQPHLTCKCGQTMSFVEKEVQTLGVKFTALECQQCGRFRFLPTPAVALSQIAALPSTKRKLIKLNQNLALSLPQAYTQAFHLKKGQEVEMTVEGFNRIVIDLK